MNIVLTSFAIILFTFAFTTEINCCSDKATDIIDLIARDPNYRFHPCYIEWKAKEIEPFGIILQREKFEQEKLEQEKRRQERLERKKLEQQSTYIDYPSREYDESNKRSNAQFLVAMGMGIIICVCVGIGSCAAFIYFSNRKKSTTETENDGFTVLSTTPGLASNAWGNETREFPSTVNTISTPTAPAMEYERSSPVHSLSSFPTQNASRTVRENTQPEMIAPLVPKGVYRQNSLPSYDDVIRIPITNALPK